MWFFNSKQKGKRTLDKELYSPPSLTLIVEHYEISELHENDAVLRFWLPEEGKQALDQVVRCNHTTGARYLRELFVVYLYGEHELQRMREHSSGLYYKPPPAEPMKTQEESAYPDIKYSIRRIPTILVVPELGKSIIPIKLYFPQKVKDGLQSVADKADVPLSSFIREILISHLFGHTYW